MFEYDPFDEFEPGEVDAIREALAVAIANHSPDKKDSVHIWERLAERIDRRDTDV